MTKVGPPLLHELVKDLKLPVKVKDKDGRVWSVHGPDWAGFWCIPEDGGKMTTLSYYGKGYTLYEP